MIINKHSKLILVLVIALIMNQKMYSGAASPLSDDLDSKPSVSIIPNYEQIFAKEFPRTHHPKINSMAIAELDRHLQNHGYFEFTPATYEDITRQMQKYDMPIDVSFSRETQRATVTWEKGGMFSCLGGKIKIKTYDTRPIPGQKHDTTEQKTPIARPAKTPFMHDVRFYDEQVGTPALANRQPLPSAIKTCVTDIPQPQHVAQQKESAVHQPRQITMSALQARDMLYNNFAQFTEISQNHYIAPEQSKQIIMDLTQFGPARFEPRIDRNNTLFLAVIWGQSEKYYKITYKEQR